MKLRRFYGRHYSFVVDSETLERIISGKKTIQLAINTAKRKAYAVGNQITFVVELQSATGNELQKENNTEKVTVKAEIDNLYYFTDIREAVETLGKEKCGFKPSQTFEKASDIFLANEKYEQVEKNGLVAISFKLI